METIAAGTEAEQKRDKKPGESGSAAFRFAEDSWAEGHCGYLKRYGKNSVDSASAKIGGRDSRETAFQSQSSRETVSWNLEPLLVRFERDRFQVVWLFGSSRLKVPLKAASGHHTRMLKRAADNNGFLASYNNVSNSVVHSSTGSPSLTDLSLAGRKLKEVRCEESEFVASPAWVEGTNACREASIYVGFRIWRNEETRGLLGVDRAKHRSRSL